MAANPFVAHVSDLLQTPGAEREHRIVAPVAWGVELSRVDPDNDMEANLTLISVSGGLMVRGIVDLDVIHTCSRCLTESHERRRVEIAQLVADDAPEEDEYHLSGDDLDLEPILRDEVLLAMPLRPRCDPPCEGLVRDSETDLNTSAPGTESGSDSPFAALQDLFGPGD